MPLNTIDRFSNYNIDSSITVIGNVSSASDYNSPFEFKTWLTYFNNNSISIETYRNSYQKYLLKWDSVKSNFLNVQNNLVKENYTALLKQISLDVFTEQELHYLRALDYNDKEQLDTVVPLVTEKIKNLTEYYKNFRETVKVQPKKNNIFSSNLGINSFLIKLVNDLLFYNSDTVSLLNLNNLNPKVISSNINFVIEELYDNYDDYFDLSQFQPASAYEYGGKLRTEQWTSNTNYFNTDLFLGFDSSIVKLLSSYEYILEQMSSNLDLPINLTSSDTQFLKNKDYINQINTGNIEDLNLNNKRALIEKFSGTDYQFLSTDSTGNVSLSGNLFKAKSTSQNFLNRNNFSTATVPNSAFLLTEKQIGRFYKPQYEGLLIYNTFDYSFSFSDTLSANTLYYYPDPNKSIGTYGNSIYTKSMNPFNVIDNTYINNFNVSNGYLFGYINDKPNFLNFHGYQNQESSNILYNSGTSRDFDKVDFFKDKGLIWNNDDVFNISGKARLPINQRQQSILTSQYDLTNSTSDVYGNNFGLYKDVNKPIFTSEQILNDEVSQRCLFLSNGYFYLSGGVFDYSKASQGYYGNNFIGLIPNQSFTFSLSSLGSLSLSSYQIQSFISNGSFNMPWCFNNFITYRQGTLYDGINFIGYDDNLLPDYPPSDYSSWNTNVQSVYYNVLLTGALGADGKKASYQNTATFLVNLSSEVDCGSFVYIDQNGQYYSLSSAYVEKFNIPYYESNIKSLSTSYVEIKDTLDRSIYDKKYTIKSKNSILRNINNIVSPLSAALSGVFFKYKQLSGIYNELNDDIIKFDVVYDIAIIETPNYIVIEKINFDFDTDLITPYNSNILYINRATSGNDRLEKFGNFFFHEQTNTILFNKTSVFNSLSSTNFKYFYPTIYKLEIDSLNFKQIYPPITDNLIVNLKRYSFKSIYKSIFDISSLYFNTPYYNYYEIDRPVLSYDSENNIYTYLIKSIDMSDCISFYLQSYKFINGSFKNQINEIYFQDCMIRDENYSNPSQAYFIEYKNLNGTNESLWSKEEGVLKLGEA